MSPLGTVLLIVLAAEPAESPCTGQRAHCVLPPAASVPWVTAAVNDDACVAPRANCLRPAALRVTHSQSCCAAASSLSVRDVLAQWEAASARQSVWSDREREWLRRQASGMLSAHALDLVLRLTQPITLQCLQQDFEWQITSRDSAAITLSATPRDDTVQLFCRELQIEFDTARGVPSALQVVPRSGVVQGVGIESTAVVTASLEIEVDDTAVPPSPSPASVIRFAGGLIEVETPR